VQVCVKELPPTIPPELGAGLVDLLNKCFYFESIQRASTMDVLEVIISPLVCLKSNTGHHTHDLSITNHGKLYFNVIYL
jgi:hypothetical protein